MDIGKVMKLKNDACKKLEDLSKDGLTMSNLQPMKDLAVLICKLDEMAETEEVYSEAGYDGYSRSGDWQARGSYGRGYSGTDGGYSGARRGRHYVRAHYSYDDGKADMIERMEDMMTSGNLSVNERASLQRCITDMRENR